MYVCVGELVLFTWIKHCIQYILIESAYTIRSLIDLRAALTDAVLICETADGIAPGRGLQKPYKTVQYPVVHSSLRALNYAHAHTDGPHP